MAECVIDWSPMSLAAWDGYFKSIRRSTLLQHFTYAQANRAVNQTGTKHGIIKIDGANAGLIQLAEVGILNNLIHAVSLDRGPLWFDGYGTAEHAAAFFCTFARQFPKRLGRKIRLLPELKDNNRNRMSVARAGFLRRDGAPGYQTIWLDLTESAEKLRANLNGKWRNILSKSERSCLAISDDWSGTTAVDFLNAYEADRIARGYDGPSTKLLGQLLDFMVPRQEALILNATERGRLVAAILILLHGSSATYQVGWTSTSGRRLGAHHQLLWQAMLRLKNRGIRDFDLGGVNDEGAKGVKKFKQGLGGQDVTLAGFFS